MRRGAQHEASGAQLLKDIRSQAPEAICELAPNNVSSNLIVNRDAPPFQNPELRRAMALSLDRKAFIDILSDGQGDIGGVMQPPPEGVWGMPPEILQTLAGYDPDVGKNRAEARGIMKPEVAFNAQGWFMTGDLGWLDDAGYLYITDRKRDNWADGDIRLRRVSLVAKRPGEGILSEPVAGTRLGSQELVLLPHTCHSRYPPGSAQLGGQRKFAPDFCVS